MVNFNKKVFLAVLLIVATLAAFVFIVPVPMYVSSTGVWAVIKKGPLVGGKNYILKTKQEDLQLTISFNDISTFEDLMTFKMEVDPSMKVKSTNGLTEVSLAFSNWYESEEFRGKISGNKIVLILPADVLEDMTKNSSFNIGFLTEDGFKYRNVSLSGFNAQFMNFQVLIAEQLAETLGIPKKVLPYLPSIP